MAREERAREDLMAEATALVERVEIKIATEEMPLVAGFRRDGSLSLFFGADVVYQFNVRNELRRAFDDDVLFKAVRGEFVALRRERAEGSVSLVGRELSLDETTRFLNALQLRLERLKTAIDAGDYSLIAQVPPTANVVPRLRGWLEHSAGKIAIADSPRLS